MSLGCEPTPCLLKHHTILMPDRHIFHLAVALAVACAVVLHLDDDAANLAVREVQHIFDNRRVLAAPSHIANQNRKPTADLKCLITLPQTDHQHLSEPLIALAAAQVACTASVLHDVPVRRVYPHKIKPARQVLLGQVKAAAKVATPVADSGALVLVEANNNIAARTRPFHRIRHSPGLVAQDKVANQPAVTIAPVP